MERSAEAPVYPCILLAAGSGSRMKGGSKLLLPLGDGNILVKAAKAALEYCNPLIVVTGKDSLLVEECLKRAGLERADKGHTSLTGGAATKRLVFVNNPRWTDGRIASIRAGIKALYSGAEGFFLSHADMPFIDPAVYRNLSEAVKARQSAGFPPSLVFPSMEGKKGHPVFFPSDFIPAILATRQAESLKTAVGCLRQVNVETTCEGIFEDIDSPQDYKRLCSKYGFTDGDFSAGKAL